MRKYNFVFLLLLIFLLACPKAISRDFLPKYSNSINYYGIGVYMAPKNIKIYSEPDEKSEIIEQIEWDRLGVNSIQDELNTKNLFISFIPEKNIALMSVVNDEENWYQVVYDQKTGLKGWIRADDSGKFLTWLEFMNKYGRDNGLYLFSDLPDDYKKIHMAPDENSQIQAEDFYSPDNVKLKIIRGNWMLVKVIDYGKTNTYIGWIRWRNDDGKIFAFPNLKVQY